jgi:DegV family protein with EDD domain
VTDSTSDIPAHLLEEQPLTVVPLTVDVGSQTYRDGVDLSREEFLTRLRRGEDVRTSQPPIGAFQTLYQQLLDAGCDVVAIHIASQLSGTFNASRAAAQAVDPARIRVIDSGTVSIACGWLALEGAERAKQGASAADIAAYLEARQADARVFAVLDTLEYLRRGGRISRASAFLGSTLQIKPILEVVAGEIHPVERVRTMRRALDRMVELATERAPWDKLAVMHLGTPEAAKALADRLEPLAPPVPIERAELGTVIGVYTGPGAMGFAGLAAPRERTP